MSNSTKPLVLVTGATGEQGGAVVSELLSGNKSTVRILTRNPESAKAKALADKGVEVYKGDFAQPETVSAALARVRSAFLVTDFRGPKGTQGETEQGKTFIDACKAAGVDHLVFTSVDGAERQSGVPHFDSKFKVEDHLRASGIAHTIFRPVAFMENMPAQGGMGRYMALGMMDTGLAGKKLQYISTKDIGWFGARAIESPAEWKGKTVALAGDELSVKEVMDVYARVQGVAPWRAPVPTFALRFLPTEFSTMFKFFRERGYQADIPALRKIYPGLHTFEQWLRSKNA